MPRRHFEDDLQIAAFEWHKWQYPRVPFLAIPNGANLQKRRNKYGKVFCSEAVKLKKMGMRPGVFDGFIPYPVHPYFGLWVEFKIKPNKPTPEQLKFQSDMRSLGYAAEIIYTFLDYQNLIKAYLNEDKNRIDRYFGNQREPE